MTRVSVPEKGVESLFGTHDENLRLLEKAFKVPHPRPTAPS